MCEFPFLAIGLDALRAPVLAQKFHLAQSAQEAAALIARNHGALLRVVEATGFSGFHHGCPTGRGFPLRKERGKYQSFQRSAACRTKGVLTIPVFVRNRRATAGAL